MISSATEFAAHFNVSRETLDRLTAYIALLQKWNARINLISAVDTSHVWHRHIADSAQLFALRPPSTATWFDMGSGAGLPGLIIAILAHERDPTLRVELAESDSRKAAFLQTAARALDLTPAIHVSRVEALPPQAAHVVSARALAPLSRLLGLAQKHVAPRGICLFPKGATVHKEINEATLHWRFTHRLHGSVTEESAAILEIGAIDRA